MSPSERFRELLRIPTVSGTSANDGTYHKAAALLASWMRVIGLQNIQTIEFVAGKPVVFGSRIGSDASLPSILLNGHYDVVPVSDPSAWSVDPFAAAARSDGRIVARGAQDMKCVAVQYLEALRELKRLGHLPARSIHVSLMPDEEVGGLDGAARFVQSEIFSKLNVGLALDEGLANPGNAFSVFYGERASNWVILRTRGPTGHGSRFIKNTAIERMTEILTRIYSHRKELACQCHQTSLGDVLSMNVTAMRAGVPSSALRGGFAVNVIPSEAEIAIDIRVPLHVHDVEQIIRDHWIKNIPDVEIEYADKNTHPDPTLLTEPVENDPWIAKISEEIRRCIPGIDVSLEVFPAGTDGRHIRHAGVPCIGFSPIRNTPILLHDNDEYVAESGFLEGIDVYVALLKRLAF